MRSWDPECLHKSRYIVGENLRRIGTFRFVAFARPSKIKGDTGEVFGIFGYLECITGVIGGQVGDENEGLTGSLLVIIDIEVVSFDLRHASLSQVRFLVCVRAPTISTSVTIPWNGFQEILLGTNYAPRELPELMVK